MINPLNIRNRGWVFGPWVLLICTMAAAMMLMAETKLDYQREVAGLSTVWALNLCVFGVLVGLLINGRRILTQLGRAQTLVAAGLFAGGIAVCFLAPRTNRIYFDEQIYEHIGQSIASTGAARSANLARVEYGEFNYHSGWVNKQPNGHPYSLSWYYRVLGVSEDVAHLSNLVYTGLGALGLFVGLSLVPWRLPRGAPLAAALLYLFTPLVPWWGHTVAAEPGAAASAVLAFAAACLHAGLRNEETGESNVASGVLLGCMMAFAANFRPESLLVFPTAAAVLISADRRLLRDPGTWAAFALGVALVIPDLAHLWSVRTEDWGATDGRRFATAFVLKNLQSNAGYFVNGEWFPVTGSILALVGLHWFYRVRNPAGIAVLIWFAQAWGIFVLFYAGGYFYGASSRYAMISVAPIALCMGVGLTALHASLKTRPMLHALLAAAALVNWLATMHFVPSVGREAAEARADVAFAEEMAPLLPQGSVMLGHNPSLWNPLLINSGQIFTLEPMVRSDLNDLRRQYPGGIYFHWNFWHNSDQAFTEAAKRLVEDTGAVLIARRQAHAFKFGIFRLDTPEAVLRFGGSPESRLEAADLDEAAAQAAKAKSSKE